MGYYSTILDLNLLLLYTATVVLMILMLIDSDTFFGSAEVFVVFFFHGKTFSAVIEPIIQLCPTLCDPMDRSLPGFSIHGIFQASVLEWVVISFSRGSSQPRDQTRVSCIAGRRFTI